MKLIAEHSRGWLHVTLLIGLHQDVHAQINPQTLTSKAIDASIYRDGEVRRHTSIHGDWRIVCDEVARLKQRFCSLNTVIAGSDGQAAATLVVSTGQDGRPAALIRMRSSLIEGGELDIRAHAPIANSAMPVTKSAPGKTKSLAAIADAGRTKLKPVACENDLCTLIWTLRPEQISALNAGRGLTLNASANIVQPGFVTPSSPNTFATSLTVSGRGFSDAVAFSTRPFE